MKHIGKHIFAGAVLGPIALFTYIGLTTPACGGDVATEVKDTDTDGDEKKADDDAKTEAAVKQLEKIEAEKSAAPEGSKDGKKEGLKKAD